MKRYTFLLSFVIVFTLTISTFAKDSIKDWKKYSQNLVATLKSNHDGLKQSAMQRVIQYSDKLDVKDAAFNIYNVYRFEKNEKLRRLALVALYNTNYNWAMDQIANDLENEQSPILKKQMSFMVNEYFKERQNSYSSLASN